MSVAYGGTFKFIADETCGASDTTPEHDKAKVMSKELAKLPSGHKINRQFRRLPNRLKSAPSLSIEGKIHTSHALMRHDVVSEKAVDIGVSLQEILGTKDAALFLKNNVIGLDVALRVLLYPELRRSV